MTPTAVIFGTEGRAQRVIVARYLAFLTAMSLVWEFAQMPLYTLGETGTAGEIIYAALHCTAGDVMIGGFSLLAALFVFGAPGSPRHSHVRVLVATTSLGLGYTLFSEWLNTELRLAWTYSELMPVVPWLGTGLTPVLQWLLIPPAAYAFALNGFGWLADTAPVATRIGREI